MTSAGGPSELLVLPWFQTGTLRPGGSESPGSHKGGTEQELHWVLPHLARARLYVAFSCLQGSSQLLPSMALPRTRSGPTPGPAVSRGDMAGLTRAGFCCLLSPGGYPDRLQCCHWLAGGSGLGELGCRPSQVAGGGGGRGAGVALLASALPVPRPHSVPLSLCFWVSASSLLSRHKLCTCAHSPWGSPHALPRSWPHLKHSAPSQGCQHGASRKSEV